MITFKIVAFKRFLSDITIATNNEAIKKRKIKKSFDSFTKNLIDTIFVRRRREKSFETKIKFRESRVDFNAFFYSTRFSSLVIFFFKKFIRRAQMKTIKRFLFELNVELRALHETFLQFFELSKNEKIQESSQRNHIVKVLRDLRMRNEFQLVENTK